ncbi:centriolar coiled-coil protein of 110 kDa-like isoform X1 [Acipenser ruthenus]|uniref:centriolar coiled-coil protein of 110 kDa-like isoform X1 n=1 Tax=Acipenser ruthenus TaxID=7906 RepID=UPI002741155A|nr:centriolar coiled-coil protein of 110 kDa-like isoform X1 [Acipenser ruthenus]XP_033894380.3 centriolar coiled-coil protein of 110 kDa-like isoform X1 [Acipenser ruthenus]XP_058845817.1 centriolar coiled-coil protein of 110 kDa-like isoform X1 [Acipenser ruthenus]
MDNYKAFCESQLRHIKAKVLEKCKKHETLDSKRSGSASLIRFHGLTILPPVLTREQRAEMQKYQQEALNCENQRKESQDHHLMIRVQTLLESVELRKAPTLQEFIQDDSGILSAVITGCKDTCVDLKNKSVESDDCSVNKWDPSLSSKQNYDRSTMFHLPTSTADEGLPTKGLQEFHNMYAEQGTNHKLQEVSQTIPSDQVQCLEINSPSVNPTLMCQNPYDQNDTSQRSVSSGYVTCDNVDIMGHVSSGAEIFHRQKDGPSMSSDRFFLHETSCDSNKVPCIPGDTLVHFSTKGNPQASKVSISDVISKHSERENTRDEKTTDLEIPEEPYLMSLQNLLKKSREFRDKQRELKKAKVRAVEKIVADGLSDKENDDDKSQPGGHNKDKVKKGSNGRVTVMSDKGVQVLSHCGMINQSSGAHEKLSTSMTLVHCGKQFLHQEMQNTKFQEYDAVNSVVSGSGKQTEPANSFTCNVLTQTEDRQKTKTLKDVRICHGVITAPTACFLAPKTSCRDASGNGVLNISSKKFKILPSPEFSKSPVHSKKITGHSRKLLVNTSLSIGNDAGEHCTKNKSTSDLQEDGQENTKRLETEQMTQLEINLSGLKALILDLESTISERSANSTLQENSIICNKSFSQEDCSSLKQTRMQSNKTCKSDSFSRDSKESIQTKSCGASLLQNKRIPDLLEVSNLESRKGYILSDTGNQTPGVESIKQKDMDNMSCHISVNKSYDVDTPSLLWLQGLQLGQEFGCQETSVTPENVKNAQESRVKRRLVMNAGDSSAKRDKDVLKTDFTKRLHNSVHPSVLERQQLQLKEEHARQISALLEEQKKQQQWIVQQIAEQSQHLHRISFQYPELSKEQTIVGQSAPAKASLTSSIILHNKAYPCSMLSQPRNFMFVTHAKITAVVKGYLTRRLLRTERLTHLIRTIQDSRLLLLTVDSPGKTGLSSHQSRSLGERVLLQLRSALYEVHDIFFNSSASERMQIISHDRKLQKQRQFNQRGHNRNPDKEVSVLSAATLKVLERKRRLLVQRTAAGGQKRQRNVQPGRLVPCKNANGTRTTVYK